MTTQEKKLHDLEKWSNGGLILHFITATGILRSSFPSGGARNRYKEASLKVVGKLMNNVDSGSLTNHDVRKGILELRKKAKCSVGLAQKGINVVLKYYCFARKTNARLLKALDCPIDSRIITYYYKAGRNKPHYRLLKLDWEDYKFLQGLIEKKEGVRILGEWVYENEYQNNALK